MITLSKLCPLFKCKWNNQGGICINVQVSGKKNDPFSALKGSTESVDCLEIENPRNH